MMNTLFTAMTADEEVGKRKRERERSCLLRATDQERNEGSSAKQPGEPGSKQAQAELPPAIEKPPGGGQRRQRHYPGAGER